MPACLVSSCGCCRAACLSATQSYLFPWPAGQGAGCEVRLCILPPGRAINRAAGGRGGRASMQSRHSTCLYACRMRVPRRAASSSWAHQATRPSILSLTAQLPLLPTNHTNHHSLAGLRQAAGCGPRPAHCAHPQPAAHQGGCWAATDCLHEAVVSPHVLLAHGLESRLAAALPGSMPCTRPGKAGQSG